MRAKIEKEMLMPAKFGAGVEVWRWSGLISSLSSGLNTYKSLRGDGGLAVGWKFGGGVKEIAKEKLMPEQFGGWV